MRIIKLSTMCITLLITGCSTLCPEICPISKGEVTIPANTTVCYQGRSKVIHISQVRCYVNLGASMGECDD